MQGPYTGSARLPIADWGVENRGCGGPPNGVYSLRMDAAILEKEALLLPDRERAVLVDRLLVSLSDGSSGLEGAWIREADDRVDAFRAGLIEAIPGSEAMTGLRKRFPR